MCYACNVIQEIEESQKNRVYKRLNKELEDLDKSMFDYLYWKIKKGSDNEKYDLLYVYLNSEFLLRQIQIKVDSILIS